MTELTPMMTKQHFEAIAAILKHERPDRDGTRWADGARFLVACGMES